VIRAFAAACLIAWSALAAGQSDGPPAAHQLELAINNLGKFDAATRIAAARTVRRALPAQAVPALMEAARGHADGYVRFRALVLLSGFNDPRTRDVMLAALDDPNDRLRTVAYAYFEYNPEPAIAARLLKALDKEESEFVRPALTRALAAYGSDPAVRAALTRLVMQGQDLFRSAVIEAVGDYRATYALEPVMQVAKQDGPLQDDAVLALGKLGDKRALEVLEPLQHSAPRVRQPSIAAAICLLGINCDSHESYLADTLKFADKNLGFQELLRGAAAGLGVLAIAGHREAVDALFQIGVPSRDPTRAPVALALATVALRNTPLMMSTLESSADRAGAIGLLAEGFDMLEEDLAKERFFATVRRTYWEAPAGSPARDLMQTLIGKLDF